MQCLSHAAHSSRIHGTTTTTMCPTSKDFLECCQQNAVFGFDCLSASLVRILGSPPQTKLSNGIESDYMSLLFPDDGVLSSDYKFSALVDAHLGEAVIDPCYCATFMQ